MSKELVSVVVPCYNHQDFIQRCLTSLIKQTYRPLEIVIVDDGSTDNSKAVIRKFVAENSFKDLKIKTFFKKNAGAHNAINFGVSKASGKIISILNSDDEFHSDRIEHLSKPIRLKKAQMTMSLVSFVDQDSQPILTTDKRVSWYFPQISLRYNYPSLSLALFIFPLQVTSGNLMFDLDIFKKVGGFKNYRWAHDYEFVIRATLFTEPVIVSKKLLSYRIHSSNTINSIAENREQFCQEIRRILEDYLAEATRIFENKKFGNVFAASPYNWGQRFKELYCYRTPFFSSASSFLRQLSLNSIGFQHLGSFLLNFDQAPLAIEALPDLINLHAANFGHFSDKRVKKILLTAVTKAEFHFKEIGTMIFAKAEIDVPYNERLALLGVFENARLVAVLRFERSSGKLRYFKGFSPRNLIGKDLSLCWLDFEKQKFVCRWRKAVSLKQKRTPTTGKSRKIGFIDGLRKDYYNLIIDAWGLLDGQIPEKIELYIEDKKVEMLPNLYSRPDLMALMSDPTQHPFAGSRYFVPLEAIEDKKKFVIKMIYSNGNNSLIIKKHIVKKDLNTVF